MGTQDPDCNLGPLGARGVSYNIRGLDPSRISVPELRDGPWAVTEWGSHAWPGRMLVWAPALHTAGQVLSLPRSHNALECEHGMWYEHELAQKWKPPGRCGAWPCKRSYLDRAPGLTLPSERWNCLGNCPWREKGCTGFTRRFSFRASSLPNSQQWWLLVGPVLTIHA